MVIVTVEKNEGKGERSVLTVPQIIPQANFCKNFDKKDITAEQVCTVYKKGLFNRKHGDDKHKTI